MSVLHVPNVTLKIIKGKSEVKEAKPNDDWLAASVASIRTVYGSCTVTIPVCFFPLDSTVGFPCVLLLAPPSEIITPPCENTWAGVFSLTLKRKGGNHPYSSQPHLLTSPPIGVCLTTWVQGQLQSQPGCYQTVPQLPSCLFGLKLGGWGSKSHLSHLYLGLSVWN